MVQVFSPWLQQEENEEREEETRGKRGRKNILSLQFVAGRKENTSSKMHFPLRNPLQIPDGSIPVIPSGQLCIFFLSLSFPVLPLPLSWVGRPIRILGTLEYKTIRGVKKKLFRPLLRALITLFSGAAVASVTC